jgi:hypothetical protein
VKLLNASIVSSSRSIWPLALAGAALVSGAAVAAPRTAPAAWQASRAPAASPDEAGPWGITEGEYHYEATVDARVLSDRKTELWARVYAPSGDDAPAQLPVLVFLHGNHGTCGHGTNPRIDDSTQYTKTGRCPDGYIPTPNHRGYDYIARNLASWGYLVVSVNANRGITSGAGVSGDSGLNLARGRLVLSHLELLSRWSREGGSADVIGIDLTGRVDLDQVALMGHSRGGEGVRAAYDLYNDQGSAWPAAIGPMSVRGIFEIAPVDGQTSRTIDAPGTAWSVLLPLCDGDVSDLEGVKPFDRMLRSHAEAVAGEKSTVIVWGANHNFFNTEWQTSDSGGCDDHEPIFDPQAASSSQQQAIGLGAVAGFFRAHVGGERVAAFRELFDPLRPAPAAWTDLTPIGRDYVLTPDQSRTRHLLELGADGPDQLVESHGVVVTRLRLSMHARRYGLQVAWDDGEAGNAGLTLDLSPDGTSVDLSGYTTLDVSLEANLPGRALDFAMQLVAADGTASASVPLASYLQPTGASGRNLLQTVRIPLGAFSGVDLTQASRFQIALRGGSGSMTLGSLRVSHDDATRLARPSLPTPAFSMETPRARTHARVSAPTASRIRRVHATGRVLSIAMPRTHARADGADSVAATASTEATITLQSNATFPVRNELPVLHVGARTFALSAYPGDGLTTIAFAVPADAARTFRAGEPVRVVYGADAATSTYVVDAGSLTPDALPTRD